MKLFAEIASKVISTAKCKVDTVRINSCGMLYIIDTDIEGEVQVSSVLSEMEKTILETKNLVMELFYINRRGKELDEDSIKRDYPLEIYKKKKFLKGRIGRG